MSLCYSVALIVAIIFHEIYTRGLTKTARADTFFATFPQLSPRASGASCTSGALEAGINTRAMRHFNQPSHKVLLVVCGISALVVSVAILFYIAVGQTAWAQDTQPDSVEANDPSPDSEAPAARDVRTEVADMDARAIAAFAITEPEAHWSVLERFKSAAEKEAEAAALFAITKPAEYARALEPTKTEERRKGEAEAAFAVLHPWDFSLALDAMKTAEQLAEQAACVSAMQFPELASSPERRAPSNDPQ